MAVICPACEHKMSGNPEVCEECGKPLPLPTGDTLVLERDEVSVPKKRKAWQSAEVGESRTVRAHIGKAVQDIHLPSEEAISLGRADEGSEGRPDVDLEPHDALAKGVSRLHAKLRLHGDLVQVQDSNSTNGTFLNEQRVSSTEWRIVRHGDELRLGNLVLKLYFSEEDKW
jgi:pSer/pThr/pTyr-binding forkhead associated (FHA) protein